MLWPADTSTRRASCAAKANSLSNRPPSLLLAAAAAPFCGASSVIVLRLLRCACCVSFPTGLTQPLRRQTPTVRRLTRLAGTYQTRRTCNPHCHRGLEARCAKLLYTKNLQEI